MRPLNFRAAYLFASRELAGKAEKGPKMALICPPSSVMICAPALFLSLVGTGAAHWPAEPLGLVR